MSTPPDLTEAEARRKAHQQMLRRLADIGMELAELTCQQAKAAVAAEPTNLLAGVDLQYSRIARAVRMTLLLEERIGADEVRDLEARQAGRAPWEKKGISQEVWAAEARAEERADEAYSAIEKAIETVESASDREVLKERLYDRMESCLDDEAVLGEAPIGAVIAAICRDLGLDPDWGKVEPSPFGLGEHTLIKLRHRRFDAKPDLEALAPAPPAPAQHPRGPPPVWDA